MVNGCRTVNPHPVGGPIIPPEELAIGSRNPDERFGGELHILPLPAEVDCDNRGVGRSRPSGAEAAEAAAGTTSTTVSTARSTTKTSRSTANTRIRHAS